MTPSRIGATPDLVEEPDRDLVLVEGAMLLGGFARPVDRALLSALAAVVAQAPFRHMVTPGGFTMSVAMTNCGTAGWVTDRRGYRYDSRDPESGLAWPAMPLAFAGTRGAGGLARLGLAASPRMPA